ncbi:hypothetical protein GGTG_06386 [Gaeumannomyces tritici R3-111a-1]|uniref:Uncharacterized protein n=1 Tax=Gaeumannomyces tritici (strain R3-111a-1) TaxID=644352 RepID=J3NYN4_GAET3|nr:hypothetical protein GGTG_06386 [Gaeumannomyces tritici R3-111a-1]EJT76467.1 hypothetical protein GGTG_06386 [Gaeumannomyces tritici R3-111a-1]
MFFSRRNLALFNPLATALQKEVLISYTYATTCTGLPDRVAQTITWSAQNSQLNYLPLITIDQLEARSC